MSAQATLGIVYPLLISCIMPMLLHLTECDLQRFAYQIYSNKWRNSSSCFVLYMWQVTIFGAFFISFISNYCTNLIFKTTNVFIYANLALTTAFSVLLICYSLTISQAGQPTSKVTKFISFNDLRLNETERGPMDRTGLRLNEKCSVNEQVDGFEMVTGLPSDEFDESDEDVVLMVEKKRNTPATTTFPGYND